VTVIARIPAVTARAQFFDRCARRNPTHPPRNGAIAKITGFVSAANPNTAFCESLLRCYEAGKSYEYDPFNSARLVKLGQLDPAPLLDRLSQGQIATVQLCCSLDFLKVDDDPDIIQQMLAPIQASYELRLADGQNPYLTHEGCYVYIPKGHD
jgi:hypothetical protein